MDGNLLDEQGDRRFEGRPSIYGGNNAAMPPEFDQNLYEDLARRILEVRERSEQLGSDSRRLHALTAALRSAHSGETMLLRCAWCARMKLADEWLALEEIVRSATPLTADLRAAATHGICPECFERELAVVRTRGR